MPESIATAFDSLVLAQTVGASYGTLGRVELQALSYVSCALAINDGRPASFWGYEFASTKSGAPHSEALARVADQLVAAGRLSEDSDGLAVTETGVRDVTHFRRFESLLPRIRYLDAVHGLTLIIPLPRLIAALQAEPDIRRATAVHSTRALLQPQRSKELEDQFDLVRTAIGDAAHSSALVPGAIWLLYLEQTKGLPS